MSDIISKPLMPLLNVAVQMMARKCWLQGYDLSETEAPDSLKRLKAEYAERGRITIYSGASGRTIFDDEGVNQDFRAWHDYCHLILNADFSLNGEFRAAGLQQEHIRARYGHGDTANEMCRIIDAEVNGQARYYAKYRTFVEDQRSFVEAYLKDQDAALAVRW